MFKRLSYYVFAICQLFVAMNDASAQDVQCYLQVVDSITRVNVAGSEVMAFLPGDSVLIAEGRPMRVRNGMVATRMHSLQLPAKHTDYNIVIDAEGYSTRIVPVKVTNAQSQIMLGEVGLMRLPKQLDEVTVTATKIKLYYKGDTLIYNADAFLLPEGSMLDDLLRKLDGVTVNRHGQIFCNGRRVESMTLDGKRLFGGSPRTLLENLGAYTVNKIKVYDYTNEHDKFVGYSSGDEKPLMMDIVLKERYSIGKWVNIDAGYGTSDRYLGRAFGLGFSKTTALSAFVNINNLSSGDNPSKGDYWSPKKADNGDSRYLSGGISYQYNSLNHIVNINGDVAANTDNVLSRSGSEREYYLTAGNNFRTGFNDNRNRTLKLSTKHNFGFYYSKVMFGITPSFSYNRTRVNGSNTSATFDEDPEHLTAADIEALYSSDANERLRHIINRQLHKNESDRNNLNAGATASATIKLPETDVIKQNLRVSADGSYSKSGGEGFEQTLINYGSEPRPGYNMYAYSRYSPTWSTHGGAFTKYELNLRGRHTLSAAYGYGYDENKNSYERYLLSNLEDVSAESLKFGMLPSESDLLSVLDPINSKRTHYSANDNRVELGASFRWGQQNLDSINSKGELRFSIGGSAKYLDRRYNYTRVNYDTIAVRRDWLPSGNLLLVWFGAMKNNLHRFEARLQWRSQSQTVGMGNLINVVNDTDPLNIFRGNPHLKNSYQHSANASFEYVRTHSGMQSHRVSLRHTIPTNEIVSGYIYDPTTGIRTGSMYNVSGSRTTQVTYEGNGMIIERPTGFLRCISYAAGMETLLGRSASMDAVRTKDDFVVPSRSFVYRRNLEPSASLSFYISQYHHSISLGWKGSFVHYDGDAEDYLPFNASVMRYNLSMTFFLPKDFIVSSDVTLRTRRGYSDLTLNSEEYIWNASASWHWKKQHLTFILDGYDILGQIKRVGTTADALGRTEFWNNTLPSYVLLRLRYHIDLSPK